MVKTEGIRKCQLIQLEMAKEVKKICMENNIQYFLYAGSLLGAIRHKGFIPWDDDLDIGMTRENYDRFLKIATRKLDKRYYLQSWDTEEKFALPIAKVRMHGTEFVEYNSKNVDIQKGIYIDIFPLDNVSNTIWGSKYQKYVSKLYIHILLNKSGYDYISYDNTIRRTIGTFLGVVGNLFSYGFIHKHLIRCITKYKCIATKRAAVFGGPNPFEIESIDKRWIEKFDHIQFEDEIFDIPAEWDKLLTHYYGDYMSPPPEDQRYIGHNIIKIRFNEK